MIVSSMYNITDCESINVVRSFIYIVNRVGPRQEPCGTLWEIGLNWDIVPFIRTLCCLLVIDNSSHLETSFTTPYYFSFSIKMVWSMVSNAFLRSIKTPSTILLLFNVWMMSVRTVGVVEVVEWSGLNPPCREVIRFSLVQKCNSLVWIIFSNILPGSGRREIGR